MLEVRKVGLKKNSTQILKDVNLLLDSKIFAIIGPNGSGKTSLAYCIMGVENDYSGSITFDKKNLSGLKINERAKLGITLAWQIPAEFEGLKVKDYLIASCGCRDLSIDEKLIEINKMLRRAGLSQKYLDKKIDELSGGERKRVELVSVAIMKPKLVILDEPDSGIDMLSFEKIKRLIKDISKEAHVLLITHSEAIAKMSDRAALLYKGEIIKQSSTGEVLKIYNNLKIDEPAESEVLDNE